MKQLSPKNDMYVYENNLAHLRFTAKWRDSVGQHTAIQHIEKFNVWRDLDLLPPQLRQDILHKPIGDGNEHHFSKGDVLDVWQENLFKTLPLKSFNGRLVNGQEIIPKAGRYYPKGWFSGVNGVYSENMFPVRLLEINEDNILVDYNHPLSAYELDIKVDILEIFPSADEHGGRCSDAMESLLSNGPGMQLAGKNKDTEFFSNASFKRIDENDDGLFYQTERKVHHLDEYARQTVAEIYDELIGPGSRVLDLMASWESHMPENRQDISLNGLGMNEAELKGNPLFNDYRIHDLNNIPLVPYGDEMFDAVICTASIEYLNQPLKIFHDIKRILKPSGKFIITFSNRWFPDKAISMWSEMHEFERMGLVTEYFRKTDWSAPVNSFSSRGLSRPENDPHYAQIQLSDPLYAVWCHK